MWSIWEKHSFGHYDHIIVGGGIVGLSAAIGLKSLDSAARVLVLERGLLPSGASTKNAGFACFGSLSELCRDIDLMGGEKALALVGDRWSGLRLLKERLGVKEIGFHNWGGYELIRPHELDHIQEIPRVNDWLGPLFGRAVFEEKPSLVRHFGFDEKTVASLIFNPLESQIDTGKMMSCLWDRASHSGVKIITGAEVKAFREEGTQVSVEVLSGTATAPLRFTAGKLALCTNAFSKTLVPDLELQPGRGLVVATGPVKGLPFQGTFHYDEGYYYFRNFGDRVLFGGGRNLDFSGEESTDFIINPKILAHLKEQLQQVILPDWPHEIDQVWTGIMAFGPNKAPLFHWAGDRILVAARLGGMGVAIGSRLGDRVASALMTGEL